MQVEPVATNQVSLRPSGWLIFAIHQDQSDFIWARTDLEQWWWYWWRLAEAPSFRSPAEAPCCKSKVESPICNLEVDAPGCKSKVEASSFKLKVQALCCKLKVETPSCKVKIKTRSCKLKVVFPGISTLLTCIFNQYIYLSIDLSISS